MVTRKSRREIEKMRTAGRIVAEVLALVESELKPGISTGHLDRIAERHIRAAGAIPSFKGYGHKSNPFPSSLCISIDDEVVHGIPGDRTIKTGQIVSIDAGAIYDGWHGDGARTFVVGPPTADVEALVESTRLAMMAGIAMAVPGARIGDISASIEDVAAPMLTLGRADVEIKPDGWTVVTSDGSLAAHFEHTIAVTENGPEILTTV